MTSFVLANLAGNYVNRLCTAKQVNKGMLGTSEKECVKV